ncbi:hypothetical protein GON01_08735 [Sphingomonas sp. MAH-20]|uniref:Uncharacterized protein n=1 Tax=Sphingomonas horti TaxID=2682842 RepID=A0A6I4J1S3_9SPHN|nr:MULTISPECIES: hypothetical protein [Sphingomonas]MBA2919777.1 hypothetical protein [Sphingomonas sp. CGMCC 1.13658]MVO78018.1 hypothetical protein [Sphingomonas horti]
MNPRTGKASKARIAWGIALGGLTAFAAYEAFASAFTNVTHRVRPELALLLSPDDPIALATIGETQLLSGKAIRHPDRLANLGKRSIKQLAVNPIALSLIGYSRSDADYRAGRSAMELADRMNRANLPVHLWLIEAAVARNDAAEALRHYDVAMRTSRSARQILSPVLTSALEDKALWPPFLSIARERPEWLPDFLRFAVRNSAKPAVFAELIEASGGVSGSAVSAAVSSELLKRLADQGAIGPALRLYASLPDADPKTPKSLSFEIADIDPRYAPLTWVTYNTPIMGSGFLRGASESENELHVNFYEPGNAQAAAKLIVVPAGTYRVRARQYLAEGSSGGRLTWEVMCQTGAQQKILWSKRLDLTPHPAQLDELIALPAGCDAFLVRIVGKTDQPGSEMVVQSPRLDRVS